MKLIGFAICAVAFGQYSPAFRNLNFAEGKAGDKPPGWSLGGRGYDAAIDSGSVCSSGRQCATLRSSADAPPNGLAFLFQVVDAKQYRGQILNLSAAIEGKVPAGSTA